MKDYNDIDLGSAAQLALSSQMDSRGGEKAARFLINNVLNAITKASASIRTPLAILQRAAFELGRSATTRLERHEAEELVLWANHIEALRKHSEAAHEDPQFQHELSQEIDKLSQVRPALSALLKILMEVK